MMEDFYAFLPSNASPDIYPDNKTAEFKIELAERMQLSGQWQAALIELHYPNTIIQVSEGENEVKVRTGQLAQTSLVPPKYYATRADFINAIREAVSTFDAQGEGIMQEDNHHRVIIHPFGGDTRTQYTFSPRLANQLGLDGPGPHRVSQSLTGSRPIDLSLGVPPALFVYMNILSDQIIGHTRAPLLRTVPLNTHTTYGTMSVYHCENPIYFDLRTTALDTLQIDIRDHTGRLVPFDYGTLTLLVHFKRVS